MSTKLFSYAVVACRYYSSTAASSFTNKTFGKKKNWVLENKAKSSGDDHKTAKKPGEKIKWTDEQKKVLDDVSNGNSVFITGSAGTGKTFLLEHCIKRLKKLHKKSTVFVTASTGIAAIRIKGQTLHSFAGVGLGDGDAKTLLDRVLQNRGACRRWEKIDALVIDEISMVGPETFESLEYIARTIRGEKGGRGGKIWGEIQLVVSGDFFQLPPVNKDRTKAKKEFAFEADCWDASFGLQIELKTVFRQADHLLVKFLQGIRKGENDHEDLELLEECCSGDEPDPSAVRLFPRIDDVNKVNKVKLESLKEEIYVYTACDWGEASWKRQLNSGIAPEELELCVGARVMLIKNLNTWSKLVNGATGTIIGFRKVPDAKDEILKMFDKGSCGSVVPVVRFDSGLELSVGPETWSVMNADEVVAVRRQIPLILAWAISIHKCQGMTLDKLHTDLSRVFDFGMAYVALSRVTTFAGLYLSGLKPSKIKAHPKVLEFYSHLSNRKEAEEASIAKGSKKE